MNTLALLTTTETLQAPEAKKPGGFDSPARRYGGEEREAAVSGTSDGGAIKALSQTVGVRLACSSVVRWYHGGINE